AAVVADLLLQRPAERSLQRIAPSALYAAGESDRRRHCPVGVFKRTVGVSRSVILPCPTLHQSRAILPSFIRSFSTASTATRPGSPRGVWPTATSPWPYSPQPRLRQSTATIRKWPPAGLYFSRPATNFWKYCKPAATPAFFMPPWTLSAAQRRRCLTSPRY